MGADHLKTPKRPFNSAVESGLRSSIILHALSPAALDVQRLIYFDYLLVHSGDVGGPASVHPALPHRSGEWLVKRASIFQGLELMFSKELVEKQVSVDGIVFVANDLTSLFVSRLATEYAVTLKGRAAWLKGRFANMSEKALRAFMIENIDRWGAEFSYESVIRGIPQ